MEKELVSQAVKDGIKEVTIRTGEAIKLLPEVAKKEVEPIRVGDKKKNQESGTVYTCFKIDGVRVYWSAVRACDGKVMKSWMGSQSWRKLATV